MDPFGIALYSLIGGAVTGLVLSIVANVRVSSLRKQHERVENVRSAFRAGDKDNFRIKLDESKAENDKAIAEMKRIYFTDIEQLRADMGQLHLDSAINIDARGLSDSSAIQEAVARAIPQAIAASLEAQKQSANRTPKKKSIPRAG